LKAIARAREFGLDIKLILGLVDREEGGREALEREAPLVTLFTKRDFVTEAAARRDVARRDIARQDVE